MNKAEVIDYIKKDDNLKEEVVKYLLEDVEFKQRLGEEVFGMPIVQLGINVPGTIGEFFLEKNGK